ncbi:hypothetical protein TNCV_4437401 [Trichonephila clavipes]|nr:hypothetical protein TNCV_4437401 [Trichonephila clavipes]
MVLDFRFKERILAEWRSIEDREKQHSLPARTMAVQSHAVRALQCASYFRAPDGDRAKGSDFLKLALLPG